MATRKLTLGHVNGGKIHVLQRADDHTWSSVCLHVSEHFHTIDLVTDPKAKPTCKFCLKVLGRKV